MAKLHLRFALVDNTTKTLVEEWLKKAHVAEWFYGTGLENTLKYLEAFCRGASFCTFWLAYDKARPFALFITSWVKKPDDPLTKWCSPDGKAITLDMCIGDTAYLDKGLAHKVIQEFLKSEFADVDEVLIDPESANTKAIHVYQKAHFAIIGEFFPAHSKRPHTMMRLKMKE